MGTVVASGFTASLNINRTLLCNVGEALALGHTATIHSGGAVAVTGGGGWLPILRRKTRKQIHDERVKLGILPADVVKAAKKAAAVVADEPSPVQAYKDEPEQANKVFLRSLGVSKMLPDYTRAIEAQIKVRQQEEEDLMLFM